MSSSMRSFSQIQTLPMSPVFITSAYYLFNTIYRLFPFVYRNGVLDISLVDNFKESYIDIPNKKPEDSGCDPVPRYNILSGSSGIVTKLGRNFVKYIQSAWNLGDIPINIQQTCTMLKVQEMQDNGHSYCDSGYYESLTPPSSDSYITYTSSNYGISWIFKTPLTVYYTEDGVKNYITFASSIGHDNC